MFSIPIRILTSLSFAGWQLTEMDEPYRKAAAAARVAQAPAIQTPAVAEGITGGDPDAVMHSAHATEAITPDTSQSAQSMLPRGTPSSTHSTGTGRGLLSSVKEQLLSLWASMLKLISTAVGRLLYALNAVFSSMDFPQWALDAMSSLAHGPMKKKLLQLYAEGGDHSRRLSSVLANGKFSSVQAGPDEPWEVCCIPETEPHIPHAYADGSLMPAVI